MMKLRFPESEIRNLAAQYTSDMGEKDRRLTERITQEVFPPYARKGFLMKDEFLTVCSWKTSRSKPLCESNDEDLIREVSGNAKKTNSEQLRIEIWTLLAGVKWPTASVFLHFGFPNMYPILDFRALWSLNIEVPSRYTFPFWSAYTGFCRSLGHRTGVSMREIDQALWKYLEIHQKR